ncbi:MAG: hypothetical protein WCF47_02430, partial [Pseudolabrys sp.]
MAITGASRRSSLPDLPTLAESPVAGMTGARLHCRNGPLANTTVIRSVSNSKGYHQAQEATMQID